jgi:hypothetical protein
VVVLIKLVKEEEGQLRAKKKEKHQPHSTQQSKREEENRRSKNNTKFLTAISSTVNTVVRFPCPFTRYYVRY